MYVLLFLCYFYLILMERVTFIMIIIIKFSLKSNNSWEMMTHCTGRQLQYTVHGNGMMTVFNAI